MLSGLFQYGYVSNDLDQAMALFRDKYDVKEFKIIPGANSTRIALTYVGPIMFEIIEGVDGAQPIFLDWVKGAKGFVCRHHHLGMWVNSREDMAAIRARALDIDHDVAMEGGIEGFVQYLYVNAQSSVGHYLEYIRPEPGLKQVFDAVPRN